MIIPAIPSIASTVGCAIYIAPSHGTKNYDVSNVAKNDACDGGSAHLTKWHVNLSLKYGLVSITVKTIYLCGVFFDVSAP